MMHQPLIPLMQQNQYGDVHTFCRFDLNVVFIIAIHSTHPGPAIGGCRMQKYPSYYDALVDAIRLGQGMTDKANIQQLPHGGGKAVIMQLGDVHTCRKSIFKEFGRCIDQLGGQYITAIDSGTTQADMEIIAQYTPHVIAQSHCPTLTNPSIYTAEGVLKAMQAYWFHQHGNHDLKNAHIAIQGVGASGMHLCHLLTELGAKVTVADLDLCRSRIAKERYQATIASVNTIHQTPCDIFAPCAFGGSLNTHTIPRLNCQAIIGCANNMCQDPVKDCESLMAHGVTYIPDYLSNGGGLIHAAYSYVQQPLTQTTEHLEKLYDTTLHVLHQADAQKCSPYQITQAMLTKQTIKHGTSSVCHEPA